MDLTPKPELKNTMKTATNYAAGRLSRLSKSSRFKVNQTVLRNELVIASMFGELAGLERMVVFIKENRKGLEVEDIEADLHLSIVGLNNALSEMVGRKDAKTTLDEYLEFRGYYQKEENEKEANVSSQDEEEQSGD